jgi:hypothetical protein|tara:strand:+ start:441 stop:611 length:171 start_codon:yes stop_codon:yes gene_type:complete
MTINNKNMKKNIIIDVTFGSNYQKKLGMKMLHIFLKVWKNHLKENHKENKIKYETN